MWMNIRRYLVSAAERHQYTPFIKLRSTLNYSPVWLFVAEPLDKMADLALWLVRSPVNLAPAKGQLPVLWSVTEMLAGSNN